MANGTTSDSFDCTCIYYFPFLDIQDSTFQTGMYLIIEDMLIMFQWKSAFILKLVFVGLMLTLAFIFPRMDASVEAIPLLQRNLLLLIGLTYLLISRFMGAAQTAMLINLADARYGATYMAVFKTVLDFGSGVVGRIINFVIQALTIKACDCGGVAKDVTQRIENCPREQMSCRATVDGLLIIGGLCFVVGIVLLQFFGHKLRVLDRLNDNIWGMEKEEIVQEELKENVLRPT